MFSSTFHVATRQLALHPLRKQQLYEYRRAVALRALWSVSHVVGDAIYPLPVSFRFYGQWSM